ncbi:MAG TPA: HEAT repeat domain-containing protein [Myxococcaceae bacterium]|nr:HEAT repeat domain-containing protein [Myxococcaceae bacterium]
MCAHPLALPARTFRTVWLGAMLLGGAALADADPRLTFLARQLGTAADPRARAQAALTLGTTEAPGALAPLCAALADPVPLVRAAVARSLPELHDLGALECLAAHAADPAPDSQGEIRRALALLRKVKERTPTVDVWVDPVGDPSSPPLGELLCGEARARLVKRLTWSGARSDAVESAPKTAGRGTPAYLLQPTLLRADGGALVMAAVCLTWPSKQILGEVRVKGSGGAPMDLIRALVPRLVQDAASTFEWELTP